MADPPPPGSPSVQVEYDAATRRVKSVKVEGGAAGLQMLELIKGAIGEGDHVNFEVDAQGGLKLKAEGSP